MTLQRPTITAEEFDAWALQPENLSRNFELIAGRIVEKVATNPRASQLAVRCARYVAVFVEDENDLGSVTGADGGYMVVGERYIPDAAYIHRDKDLVKRGYNPEPPDLVIEVISADIERRSDRQKEIEELLTKVSNYLAAGVEVWIIDPDKQTLAVHHTGRKVLIFGVGDTLVSDVLPGFTLEMQKLFRS
jgi:Uma2 family endonuclease